MSDNDDENWGGISDGFSDLEHDPDSEPDTEADSSDASKPAEPSEPDEPANASDPDQASPKTQTRSTSTSVKEEQTGTYFYLPESQHKELNYQYKLLSAAYERAFDEEFEKNRHFYPLVVQYGLETVADAEPSELRSWLQSVGNRTPSANSE